MKFNNLFFRFLLTFYNFVNEILYICQFKFISWEGMDFKEFHFKKINLMLYFFWNKNLIYVSFIIKFRIKIILIKNNSILINLQTSRLDRQGDRLLSK